MAGGEAWAADVVRLFLVDRRFAVLSCMLFLACVVLLADERNVAPVLCVPSSPFRIYLCSSYAVCTCMRGPQHE